MLLRKGYYPYEDADSWEKIDKKTIPLKEAFYRELNLEGIIGSHYAHVQKLWEVFEIKKFGEYHNLLFKVVYRCLQMSLKTLEICVLLNMGLILLIF